MRKSSPIEKGPRNTKYYLGLFFKGMAMGAADVVPGVSGGTIALISGIYDELIRSLSAFEPRLLSTLYKNGIAATWNEVNGWFLLVLFSGILLSIKTFAAIISHALLTQPILVWSFFTGLILASIPILIKQQSRWRWRELLVCLIGATTVYVISVAAPAQLPGHWWVMFLGGFIAICAMILPGVSGSFLLLLAGLYPVFIEAINQLQWVLLASFGLGCLLGLIAFSRVLAWLLTHFHSTTLALLIGFLIGSLNVTWPWKQTLESTVNRHGETVALQQKNILPGEFQTTTGSDPLILTSIGIAVLAAVLVLFAEFFSLYRQKKSK